MRIPALFALLGMLMGWGVQARGQSLGDVAKKEQVRRKTVNGTGKVYTNQDLKGVPAAPADDPQPSADATDVAQPEPASADVQPGDPSADAQATANADAAAPDADADGEEKDEEYWRTRMEMLTQKLERDELLTESVQSRINALTADFASRDDPAQRSKIGVDRQRALAELDRLKRTVAADSKAIAAFEDEARKAGVPPGWIR